MIRSVRGAIWGMAVTGGVVLMSISSNPAIAEEATTCAGAYGQCIDNATSEAELNICSDAFDCCWLAKFGEELEPCGDGE